MCSQTCQYCNRNILNKEAYDIHVENCSNHPKYQNKHIMENVSEMDYKNFLSHQFIKKMIIESSSHMHQITKNRFIKLLQYFICGMALTEKDSDYIFLQRLIYCIQSNKKIIYSLKEREDTINYILYNGPQLEIVP